MAKARAPVGGERMAWIAAGMVSRAHQTLAILMVTQTIGWGSSVHLVGAFAQPISDDLQLSRSVIYSAITVMYLTGSLCSPIVGRWADKFGAGFMLAAGSTVFVAALALLSSAGGMVGYLAAWFVFGVGMHLALATSSLAMLSQVAGGSTRRYLALLSLVMGLSSSISWPIAVALEASVGWRTTCLIYAAVVAGVTLPLHLYLARLGQAKTGGTTQAETLASGGTIGAQNQKGGFRLVAISMTMMAMVASVMSTMLIDIFSSLGLSRSEAAQVASLVGIAFFVSRLLEFFLGPLVRPVDMAVIGFSAVILALLPLVFWPVMSSDPITPTLAGVCALLYGVPTGLFMILRATLVLELFGSGGYGHRMGLLYRPMDVSNATAPLLFSPLLAFGGGVVVAALLVPAGLALTAILTLRRLLLREQ